MTNSYYVFPYSYYYYHSQTTITHYRKRNPTNLRNLPMSANTLLSFSIGLWNCRPAVNKADLITSITSHSRLNLMALTETWIKPEDTATPAALSNNFSFSHSPRLTGRSVGRGVASGGERVTECIGPRGLGDPWSPGHREHRNIPFE